MMKIGVLSRCRQHMQQSNRIGKPTEQHGNLEIVSQGWWAAGSDKAGVGLWVRGCTEGWCSSKRESELGVKRGEINRLHE